MIKYVVFQNKETADAVLQEICVTPYASVWVWFRHDESVNEVQYAYGADGKCFIAHDFTDEDVEWLVDYTSEIEGIQILDVLPVGWQYTNEV